MLAGCPPLVSAGGHPTPLIEHGHQTFAKCRRIAHFVSKCGDQLDLAGGPAVDVHQASGRFVAGSLEIGRREGEGLDFLRSRRRKDGNG